MVIRYAGIALVLVVLGTASLINTGYSVRAPNDLYAHAALYFISIITLGLAVGPLRSAVGLFAIGCLLEVAQTYVPGRSGSLLDVAANAAGLVGGLMIYYLAAATRKRVLSSQKKALR